LTGAPFADPATIKPREQVVALPSQPIAPVVPPSPQPTPTPAAPVSPPPAPQDKQHGSSGTGVFISSYGLVLTNAHVVNDCSEIQIAPPQGSFVPAQIFGRDPKNDLAILKTGSSPLHFAALRTNIRLGENVEAFGYPLVAVLASSGNFTLGNVTALAGLGDDSRYLQISAPVQPGNSGGPLLDQSGNLVGIVSAKLNALNVMVATNGDIPQNVNFAIKASLVATFLQTNDIKFETGTSTEQMQPADIADKAKSISVLVECR
jgi:serine protease Do